jgi:hypothetical protein
MEVRNRSPAALIPHEGAVTEDTAPSLSKIRE